jgi:NTE family protein
VNTLALVFGGGNAVAAFDAGAFEAFAQAGHVPGHVAGASAGAMTAVLVAGNAPENRVGALRAFWDAASSPGRDIPWMPAEWARAGRLMEGLSGKLFGRPSMYRPRLEALLDPAAPPGLQDPGPLRATLARLVDLGRLNDGPIRVSINALDIETGEEVVFDNRTGRIELDHVLASAALLPDFPPVSVGGRLLVDGGLAANAPAHLVLDPPQDGLVCFVADPFPLAAAAPKRYLDAQERQTDLIFAAQTRRTLVAAARGWERDGARGVAWRVEYRAGEEETALKGFDFSRAAIDRRWQAGLKAMRSALEAWGGAAPDQPGLTLHLGHQPAEGSSA